MIAELLRYLKYSLLWPDSRSLGFLSSGFGIARRRSKLSPYWEPHLEHSKKLEREWLKDLSPILKDKPSSLLILGAGHLYDCELSSLAQEFSSITLIDANPVCARTWRKHQAQLSSQCCIDFSVIEMTGVLKNWRTKLNNALKQKPCWEEALGALREIASDECLENQTALNLPPSEFCTLGTFDAVLSLNTLGQIALIWQDCVEALLIKRFSNKWVAEREREWLLALYPSAQALVLQHLRDLAASNATSILLITDLEYVNYVSPFDYLKKSSHEPPITWKPGYSSAAAPYKKSGTWEPNESMRIKHGAAASDYSLEIIGALYEQDIEDPNCLRNLFPDYGAKALGTWLWHIAPKGVEYKDHGTVIRVGAWSFFRQESKQNA